MKKENIKTLAAMIFGSFLVWMIVIALISMLARRAGHSLGGNNRSQPTYCPCNVGGSTVFI